MFRIRSLAPALLGLGFFPAAQAEVQLVIDIATLYGTRNDAITDNFYSIDYSQIRDAQTYVGYYGESIVAFVPKTENPYQGIRGFGRFWKGAPQNEHFYTSIPEERAFVRDLGWEFEREEGALIETSRPGLVPLHRLNLSRWDGDLQHVYTTRDDVRNQYMQAGWSYDGPTGYAFAYRAPEFAEYPYHILSGGTLYVVAPAVNDPSVGTQGSTPRCGGNVKVEINGSLVGTFSNLTYGPLPGQYSQNGCYANTGRYLAPGTYNLRLASSGYAARIAGHQWNSGPYDYWRLIAPATRFATATR